MAPNKSAKRAMVTPDDMLQPRRHALYEDVFAVLLGTILIAVGIVLFTEARLVSGGLSGAALVLFYLTGQPFGLVFFLINLPFYVLAVMRMGWAFAARTVAAVLLVSYFTSAIPRWMDISSIDPLFAAAAGGGMLGLGMLSLARHRTSVGGINILALFLQERYGIRAGYFQLAVDALVMLIALMVLPIDRVAISLLAAVIVNLILAVNHKPGRYLGFS